MRKFPFFVVLLSLVLLSPASCSSGKLDNGSPVTANEPANSNNTDANASTNPSRDTAADIPGNSNNDTSANLPVSSNSSNSSEAAGGASEASMTSTRDIAAIAENPVDDSITFESVRKAAQDAGYTVEDIQDIPQREEPNPVRGFFLNYKDENTQSQSPIYEFKTSSDAQEYARRVSEAGYALCIVNGKLLAPIGSNYGIVSNDKEKAALEAFLKSRVMDYVEPDLNAQAKNDKDFAGACTRITAINKALATLVNKSVLLYTKSLPAGDPNINIGTVTFSMASSSDMAFISTLCEDQAKMDAVVKTWELYGCTNVKLKHDTVNNYILTGKRAGMDTSFNILAAYSPAKDSLRILDKDGSQIADYFEFVPLGGDKYAVQTLYDRAIVEYRDGKIASLIYSVRTRTKENKYNPGTDSIYPNGSGIDAAWVSKLGEDKYEQFITFDGTKLGISAIDFTGAKLKVEMNVK